MANGGTPEAYTAVLSDPAAWLQTAETLWATVRLLAKELPPFLDYDAAEGPPSDRPRLDLRRAPQPPNLHVERRFDLIYSTSLLMGFAAENYVKAAYVKCKAIGKSESLMRLPPGLGDHRMHILAEKCDLDWSVDERELLQRLTTIVRWAGRYPAPSSAQEPLNVHISSSTDLRTMVTLRRRVINYIGESRYSVEGS